VKRQGQPSAELANELIDHNLVLPLHTAPVIASAARQSSALIKRAFLDCHVAARRAMAAHLFACLNVVAYRFMVNRDE